MRKPRSRTNEKPKVRKRGKWSLLGDATANLKAWSKKLTIEDVIEMSNEPLEFEVKLRPQSELRKRRAG